MIETCRFELPFPVNLKMAIMAEERHNPHFFVNPQSQPVRLRHSKRAESAISFRLAMYRKQSTSSLIHDALLILKI